MSLEQPLLTVVVERDEDLVFLRQRIRDVAHLVGLGEVKTTRLSTALSEVARRVLRSGGGRVRFGCALGDAPTLHVRVGFTPREEGDEETRPGLPFPNDLDTAATLVDDMSVHEDDGGTTIALSVGLPEALDAGALRRLSSELARRTPADPVSELERQNHEVMTALERLQRAERLAARVAVERETILELVPVIVWTARPSGERDYFSPRWEEITGIEPHDARGRGWLAAVHPSERESVAEAYEAGIASGESFELEWRMVCADGTKRWHLDRAVPLREDGGAISKWYGSTANIDERRRREEEASRTNAFLKRIVSVVGHDLRAPLSVVTAATELLAGSDDPALKQSAIQRLRKSTERATRMIDDLLDYTRAELGGGLAAQCERCELRPALEGLIEQAGLAHPDHRIELDLDGPLAGVFDTDRIVQAVSNLLENAAAHADPEHPIVVSGRDRGDPIEIEVRNRGPVVPQEVLEHIFEPFQRSSSGRNRKGLGLGLYIVSEIARSHGGRATMFSDEERGTRVVLELPKEPQPPGSAPPPRIAATP